jgi:nucleoid-associated protein YgaU
MMTATIARYAMTRHGAAARVVIRPDVTRPDAARHDAARHDAAGRVATRHDAAGRDVTRRDAAVPDAARCDAAAPDVAAPDATGRRPAGLRLTRRGRVVFLILALLVVCPIVVLSGTAIAGAPGHATEVTVHTVAPGETLWGYASQIAGPGEDVRDVVADLIRLNELTSASLRVGQTIVIPQ